MKTAWFAAFVFACLLGALLAYGVRDRLDRRLPIAGSNYAAEAERALQEYFVDHEAYPKGDNHAITLQLWPDDPLAKNYFESKRKHIQEKRMLDPWNKEMRIRIISDKPVVTSAGADGIFDTADDIGSEEFLSLRPYPTLSESDDIDLD